MVSKKTCVMLLVILTILLFAIGYQLPPLPQSQSYHDFADQRSYFSIPNTWDVLSNVPFAIAGLWGMFQLCTPNKIAFINSHERWPWMGFSIGLILIALGSGYYHLSPDDSGLILDRLSMIIAFTSYAAALICDRISVRLGLWLWPVFLIIGISSVLVWSYDLRLYVGVQAFSILLPLVMLLTPPSYTRSYDLAVAAFFYVLAVILEKLDEQIYQLTDKLISGHALKHVVAALAGFWLIRMLLKRKQIQVNGETKA